MSLSLSLYRLATGLAEPLAPMLLTRRAAAGKEDPERLGERLGQTDQMRPAGPLVWIHGASVGESLSHLPLLERWSRERPDVALLVTSGTRTSAELLSRRLPEGTLHQYLPVDAPRPVARFLEHWRPDLGILVESELWPNLLLEARRRGVRLALVGARLSESTRRRWSHDWSAARTVLGVFDAIWAQDHETRAWIEGLGVKTDGELDLKRLAQPLPCDEAALDGLAKAVDARKVVTAASTHPGEDHLIADALKQSGADALLILVPRHPERGPALAEELAAAGWRTALRSRGEAPSADTGIYIADTLGELGLFYRLATVVVMGGSLLEQMKGHNPLEPARLGRPVISGPHVEAFVSTYAGLLAEKAVLMAHDQSELSAGLGAVLGEPKVARELGERAEHAARGDGEAFEAAWQSLQRLVPRP